ncbi:DNA-binding transcriptional regulator LsrR (DeoR family) [Rhodobacter sp. JA431]|uniref:sugar-binding transcriptional regulator n=1 Tax=Rhodobacter sp. JA431 TaxID=570013 RepID=UPI000BDCCDFB|nr:sugar-binding transcriptional regulator [Rhodobacter sp. JA431]SOC05281.1 DNA-binding transcriptional regulator LsrR (DeoR family) [Rhodobacter sp. JA431]
MSQVSTPQDNGFLLDAEEVEQISRAAWHYYNDGLTQNQIADLVGVSRIKVSRLLEKGRQAGLIELRINSPHEGSLGLQEELVSAFGLTQARVVPQAEGLAAGPRIGRAAASLLTQGLCPNDLLAIGWGEAVSTTLRYMAPVFPQNNISLVSLTGGVSAYIGNTGLYGPQGFAHLIPTPLRVSSTELAEMLRLEPYVRNVLDMALTAKTALIGVGSVARSATLVRYGYCTGAEIELFTRRGAVGDVLGYFYDRDGQILDLDVHRHVVAVTPDDLRQIPSVIGAAAGPEKVEAILGLLRGRLANILVTDEPTARELLRRK